eukprot:scaffold29743_cov129-Isochrysis_galbana.AAC.1
MCFNPQLPNPQIFPARWSQPPSPGIRCLMFERQEGMDVMEVARALTRAYVQKQGDQAGIDVRTVWNHTHMAHEINNRMIIVLTTKTKRLTKERGADNAMKFKELLAAARVRVKNREGMPHEASCVHICENYLGPYEEARSSLYEKSKLPAVPCVRFCTDYRSRKTIKFQRWRTR